MKRTALVVTSAFLLGFLVFLPWWVFTVVWLASLAAAIWSLSRSSNRRTARWNLLALILIVGWGLVLTPMKLDEFRHDRLFLRIEDAMCQDPPVPAGTSVVSCERSDLGVHNPSNGNQCGYVIILRLETHAAVGRLRSFYETVNLPDSLAADLVVGVAPWAEYETPGHARVDLLVIGDEGMDIRCM
jgi:hypothetical protein